MQPKQITKKLLLTTIFILILGLCFVSTALAVGEGLEVPIPESTNPMNGTVDVDPSLTKEITVTFTQNVITNMGQSLDNIVLEENGKGIDFEAKAEGKVLTIKPVSGLKPNSEYYVFVQGGLFKSVTSGLTNPNVIINFTTGEVVLPDATVDPIADQTLKFGVKEEAQLEVVTNPADAAKTYQLADGAPEGIVTFDEDGLIKAAAVGETYITVNASAQGYNPAKPVTLKVTVEPGDIVLTVDPTSLELAVGGENKQITASTDVLDTIISYQSNDTQIAIFEDGYVKPVAEGNTTITVTAAKDNYNLASVDVPVVVKAAPVLQLEVSPSEVTLVEGAAQTLTVQVTEGAAVTYVSDDPDVAKAEDKVITGVKAGTAKITVTATLGLETLSKDVLVTVTEAELLPGDINFDGEINITDVQMAINISLGKLVPSEQERTAADVVGEDGAVNILDVVRIINLSLEAE